LKGMDVYATIYQPCWKNCFQAACRSNQVEQGGFNAEIFNCIRFSKKRGKRTIIMNSDADNHSPLSDTTRERNSVSNVLYSSSNTTHSSRSTLFLTFSLVLLVGIAVFRWHRINDVPSGHDSAAHAEIAIHLANVLSKTPTDCSFLKAPSLNHLPLTYLIAQAFLRLFASPTIGFAVTMAALVSVMLLFSLAVSAGQVYQRSSAFLPLFLLIGCPVFWKIALAFNLEISLLLTAAVAVALIDEAEKLSWRFTLPLAAVVLFLFSFSKMVVALLILPSLLGWTLVDRSPICRKRILLLLSLVAALVAWALPRLGHLVWEVKNAAHFPQDNNITGPTYFVKVMAVDFLGMPLLIAFAVLLIARIRNRTLAKADLVFAASFVLPLVFFIGFKNQRPWFFLTSYILLGCWFIFSVDHTDTSRLTRRLVRVVSIFSLCLSVVNTIAVMFPQNHWNKAYLDIVGIPAPDPLSPTMNALADFLSAEMIDDQSVVGVIGNVHGFDARRLYIATLMRRPKLALAQRLFVADRLPTDIKNLLEAYHRITILVRALDPNDPEIYTSAEYFADLLQGIPAEFLPIETPPSLPPPILAFRRQTVAPLPNRSCPVEETIGFYRSAEEHFRAGRFLQANALASLAIRCDDEFTAARLVLCKSLIASGRLSEAKDQIKIFFLINDHFEQKMSVIEFLSHQVIDTRVEPDFFFEIIAILSSQPLLREQRFALLGWCAYVEQELGRLNDAIETLDKQLGLSSDEERPGLVLSKARVLEKVGDNKSAKALAESVLQYSASNSSVHAEAALLLSQLAVSDGDLTIAHEYLRTAAADQFEEFTFANVSAHLAIAFANSDQYEDALAILVWAEKRLSGPAKAYVLIEHGKLLLALSQSDNALAAFQEALTEDTSQREWLLETIATILDEEQ